MTPMRIVRLFGMRALPFVMALIGALALITLVRDAGLYSPNALLSLLLGRYEDLLELLLGPVEPMLIEHLQPHWPAEAPLAPSPFWRHGFALGAMVAIGLAAPFYRRGSVFPSILVGALGLLLAAAAALAFDQFAPGSAEARLAFAGIVLGVGFLFLIGGVGRARREAGAGWSFFASWRDGHAVSSVGWTVIGALLVAAVLVGLDASDYSAVIAAWLWFV